MIENNHNAVRDGILGLCVGDALGVPVEFESRETLRQNPVTGMRGYGNHNQPAGTWSDDTGLTLCLADSLAEKGSFVPEDVMQRFALWLDDGKYTAHGEVFDVGIATQEAIERFKSGVPAQECGGKKETDNGNGALMRILPMALLLRAKYDKNPSVDENVRADLNAAVALTHAHPRNLIACGIYCDVTNEFLSGNKDTTRAIQRVSDKARMFFSRIPEYKSELTHFERLIYPGTYRILRAAGMSGMHQTISAFKKLPESEIQSTGYVVHTLEAALWCLLNTSTFEECVLKAVNLGGDTDTTAAVAGSLAGLLYGINGIPDDWLSGLVRGKFILEICDKFQDSLQAVCL
jgi:ADP-ribosylglycohydrolase